MVSDVDILQVGLEQLSVSISEECFYLSLVLIPLSHVSLAQLLRMLQQQALKLNPNSVLLHELHVLFILVEGRGHKFLSPPWSIAIFQGAPEVLRPRVRDNLLIVVSLAEGPDFVLIETMIDQRYVRVWWVSVDRLTLCIIPKQFLISVHGWDDSCGTHCGALLGHEWLQTLEVVRLEQAHIVHVAQLAWVIHNCLVEAREWIVKAGIHRLTFDQRVQAQMETVVDLECTILSVIIVAVGVRGVFGATESLLLSVQMDAPQVVNTIVDGLLV